MSEDVSSDTNSQVTISAEDDERATGLLMRAQTKLDAGDVEGAQRDLAEAKAIRAGKPYTPASRPDQVIVRASDGSGRFAPGTNAGGGQHRTGFIGLARHVRDTTRNGLELVEFALRVLRDEDQMMKDRLSALAWLGDRGFGRPVQAVELVASVQTHATLDPAQVLARLSDAALRELAEAHDALKLASGDDAPVIDVPAIDDGGEP